VQGASEGRVRCGCRVWLTLGRPGAVLDPRQAELGEHRELHRTFIGSVERGERNLALLNLRKIAQVLRIPLSELLAEAAGGGEEGE
jgi:transcriptional regulator with XRE-family HTH domain